MRARRLVLALVVVAAPCSVAHADPPPRVARSPLVAAPTATATIPSSPGGRPTAGAPPPALTDSPLLAGFIENRGHIDGPAAFYRRTGRQTLWLTPEGVVFDLRRGEAAPGARRRATASDVRRRDVPPERLVFSQEFVGAKPGAAIEPRQMLPGVHNYFLGNDPTRWRTGVRAWSGVTYRQVWDGIDFIVRGNGPHLEQEFVVRPGADPGQIRVAFRGIDGLRIAEDGTLVIQTAFGDLRESAPTIYQEISGKRVAVSGRFKLISALSYTVEVQGYQPSYALVIDPTLVYSRYLGGSGDDGVFNPFAVDSSGNVYLAGSTDSTDFPGASAIQAAAGGFRDTFIVKLGPGGDTLVYATYLGGNGQDDPGGIAVDALGNGYVAGTTTSTNFPTQNPLQANRNGGRDAFVTKLNSTGSALVYSTYLGGSGEEFGQALTIDGAGNVYVVGDTNSSTDWPTVSAVQPTYGGGVFDGFVAKLNAAGSALLYSTYLGGSGQDSAKRVVVDSTGIYVAGSTDSATGFPIVSAAQPTFGGVLDGFVSKLNLSGSALIYSTYLGGDGVDAVFGLAVDGSGEAHLTGVTSSSNFPLSVDALQPAFGGGDQDAFVTKLVATGASFEYSTYLGGAGFDEGEDIALDAAGYAYVAGVTSSTNFPTRNAVQPTYGGGPFDAFAAILPPTGISLLTSTYLGGSGDDKGFGIAFNSLGPLVAGWTTSADFPRAGTFAGPAFAGVGDAFVTHIGLGAANLSVTMTASPTSVVSGGSLTYTMTVTNAGPELAVGATLNAQVPVGTAQQSLSFQSSFSPFLPGAFCQYPTFVAGPLFCDLVNIPPGGSWTISLVVQVTAPSGTVTNTAAATSLTPDPSGSNNSQSTNTPITASGGIQGQVTQLDGVTPIAGALVRVSTDTGFGVVNVVTDAGGNYGAGGLAAGPYKVSAEANGFGIRYFNGKTDQTAADIVTVASGATTMNVNIALPGNAGSISGRVTRADGVTPIPNASVAVKISTGANVIFAVTDASGNYNTQRRLSAGSYIVRVTAAGFPITYYVSGSSTVNATVVTVATNADTTGINVKLAAGAGGISGRISRTQTGLPLSGVNVTISDGASGGFIQGFLTDAGGFYNTGLTLAPGVYKVSTVTAGSEMIAYDGKFSVATGDPVTVGNGVITAGIDIALPLLGGITGTVMNAATGAVLGGATVSVNDYAANTFITSVVTAADGRYTINNLNPLQSYRVRAVAPNFGNVFFSNKPSAGSADIVQVPAGGTTTIDFALAAGGGIRGTVTDAATLLPIQGVTIDVIDGSSANLSINNFANFAVTTDVNGIFNTGRFLAPGVYKLRARKVGSGYIQTFHPNGRDLSTAATVTVVAGADTLNVNIAMPLGGTITGTILDRASVQPLAGATVIARRQRSSSFFGDFTVTTNANGIYTIKGLHAGEWLITAQATGHVLAWYSGDPINVATDFSTSTPIQITGTNTASSVDLTLARGGGQVRGRVTRTDTGQPVPTGTFVAIRGPWPRSSSVSPASVQTTAQGDYSFSGLPPGRYIVEADRVQVPNGTAIGFFPFGAVSRATGVPVTVSDGGVVTADFQVVGFSGGATPRSIRGTLKDPSNSPIRDAQIFLLEPTATGLVRVVTVFDDGSFAMDGLVPGRYLLQALTERTFALTNFPAELTANTATVIDVTGGDVAGINVVMPDNAGTITGRITRSGSGEPIVGASIGVRSFVDAGVNGSTSEIDGSYLVRGVRPGVYKVRVSAPGFITKFFKVGVPAGVPTHEDGSFVTVTAGTNTPAIDVSLDPTGGALTGTVRRQDTLEPVVAAVAVIHDATTGNRVTAVATNATGTWRTEGLGPGTYAVGIVDVQTARHATQWYSGEGTVLTANPVTVAAVGVTGGIDVLASANRGSISGRVFGSDGVTPLAAAAVEILDSANGGLVRRALAGSDGVWQAQGLAPGINRYVARARALGFADRFFPAVPTQTGATALTVANGADTPNINFSMTLSSDITGRVSYGGAQTGALVVSLFRGAGFTELAYQTVVPTPVFAGGQVYGFAQPAPDSRGLLPDTYQIRAFVDGNGNGVRDPTEASGSFVSTVAVTEAVIRTGADLTLVDPAATTNAAPVANAETVLVVQGTTSNSIILTGEDAETATANLAYAVTTSPLHGTLATTLDPQQRLYTPAAGFTGTDTFTFTVTDRGDPEACGAPGPTCASALTSAPATVTIQVAPNAGTTSQALASPAIPVNSTGFTLGSVRIDENAVGVLAPGSAIRVGLPPGLAFVGTPTVSLAVGNGAVLNPPVRESNTVIAFTLAAPSTTGPASILVSAIAVDVPLAFLDDGVTSAAVLTTVFGANPGVTAATVQNATVVAPAAGPAFTSLSPATAAQGTTGRVITISGANFATDATVSFGAGVAAAVVVDGPDQITATLTVAANATPGLRDVVVTNVGAGQSVTKASAFEITGLPAILTVSGPLVQGLDNQLVTITGTNFGAPTTTPSDLLVNVSGGGITVTDVGYAAPTTLTAIVNVSATAAAASYDVGVTNPDGGSAIGLGLLQVTVTEGLPAPPSKNTAPPPPPAPPVISSLATSAGPVGSNVTISGSNFGTAPLVSFAGANGTRLTAAVSGASASSVTATVPAGATTGNVTVTANSLVSNGVLFAVTTPLLASVVPNVITTDPAAVKQVQLTLSGSRFVPGATVTFGGPVGDITPVGGATVSPDGLTLTQTVSIAPALQLMGPRDVVVQNPGACNAPAPATCLSSTLVGGIQVQPPPAATFTITLPDLADDSTYLPSVSQVTLARLAGGACNPATKVVTPSGARLQAQFVSGAGLTPPPSVTFTIASSALPGTATNENCEIDPANPTRDFSVGQPTPASQQVVVQHGGGGLYQTTLFSYDWGGKVTVSVTGTTGSVTASASRLFPVDADGDDLPDAYERNGALNGAASGVNALSFQNSDQNGNAVKDRDDRFARDGLSNFEKYRGVYLVGPTAGAAGSLTAHERLGAGRRHLFARGRGFRDDPAVAAGFCGINPATGAPVADATLSAANPCPGFQVGAAFAEIGVAVHNVSASFTASTELPRVSLVNAAQLVLDLATVTYDGVNCKGAEACGTISKFGVRQWGNATLGYTTPNGTATAYGNATIYKRAVECYFNCKPYAHRTNDPARVIVAPDGTAMLAPIAVVGDSSTSGRDNGRADTGEALINGVLAGDTYIPGSFTQQLSALDVNSDGCIELPTAADPTQVARCSTGADTAPAPSATKQQVVRSIVTHELGHATGVATHTSDSTDIMYLSTINFTRDSHFSATAAGLVQVHSRGVQ